jgi:hypothetical protein
VIQWNVDAPRAMGAVVFGFGTDIHDHRAFGQKLWDRVSNPSNAEVAVQN